MCLSSQRDVLHPGNLLLLLFNIAEKHRLQHKENTFMRMINHPELDFFIQKHLNRTKNPHLPL